MTEPVYLEDEKMYPRTEVVAYFESHGLMHAVVWEGTHAARWVVACTKTSVSPRYCDSTDLEVNAATVNCLDCATRDLWVRR